MKNRISVRVGAAISTIGTNRCSSFLVKRCVGLFCASASVTMLMTRAMALSLEILVTSTSSIEPLLMVPA